MGKERGVFVTLPKDLADDIKSLGLGAHKGFGSIKVRISIGDQTWDTSIFPSSKTGSYDLPIKKDVRQKLGVEVGDELNVKLAILG